MAMNKKVLIKIREKTKGKPQQLQFLSEIFEFEFSVGSGWYNNKYNEILKNVLGDAENED